MGKRLSTRPLNCDDGVVASTTKEVWLLLSATKFEATEQERCATRWPDRLVGSTHRPDQPNTLSSAYVEE